MAHRTLLCQTLSTLLLWSACALRTMEPLELSEAAPCRFKAVPGDLDFRSSVFDVDFSFLRSRDFHLSTSSSCDAEAQLASRTVPRSLHAKKALLEQRFVVKQLKEGLQAVKKENAAIGLEYFNRIRGNYEAHQAPAVELQMYPEDPMNATSRWKAVLVPRTRQVFDNTFYLCEEKRCVAEVTFEALPFRFLHFLGISQALERIKSFPHSLVLFAELAVILGILAFLSIASYSIYSWQMLPPETPAKPDVQVSGNYQLLQHVDLYDVPHGNCGLALEAGTEITIAELESRVPESWFFEQILHAISMCGLREPPGLWARLKSPDGWILIHSTYSRVAEKLSERKLFEASPQLVVPLPSLGRSILILVASYMSTLWFFIYPKGITRLLFLLCLELCLLHCFVLYVKFSCYTHGLEHDEMLQKGTLLPSPTGPSKYLIGIIAASLVLATVGACCLGLCNSATLAMLLLAVGVHCYQFRTAVKGLEKWREPELRCGEFHAVSSSLLPHSEERPETLARPRQLKRIFVRFFLSLAAIVATVILGLLALEGCQVRGELINYSWSRGHLVYPAESQGFHNTLLLDSTVDTMTLNVDVAKNTRGIGLRVHHPQLEEVNDTFFETDGNESVEFQVFLPTGPLYTGLEVTAVGFHVNTTYVFHALRVGAAVNISMKSDFQQIKARFQETRRLKYQKDKQNWYIPGVDLVADSNFSVEVVPVVFAPLVHPSDISADTPAIGEQCNCGNDTAGFGNMCELQLEIDVSNQPKCVYLTGIKSSFSQIGGTRVGGDVLSMRQWLVDLNISGKSVAFLGMKGHEGSQLTFNPQAIDGQLKVMFEQRLALQRLVGMPAQMQIALTSDLTDSEAESVSISIIPHPPPLHLSATNYLLPTFQPGSRKDYAWCAWDGLGYLSATVDDERFTVEAARIPSATDCTGKQLEGQTFTAKRKESCEWCHLYTPWAETYDVSVVRSAEKCLVDALVYNDLPALERVMQCDTSPCMFSGATDETKQKCMKKHGVLGEALRRNNMAAVNMMLHDQADPNDVSLGELPLSIAAELGNVDAMRLLLEKGARINEKDGPGETALFKASKHCQLESIKVLLSHKEMNWQIQNSVEVPDCDSNETALLAAILDYDPLRGKCGIKGSQLSDVVKVFESYKVKLEKDSCEIGSALLKSVDEHNLAALGELLAAGADPNKQIETDFDSRAPLIDLAANRGFPKSFQMEALKMLMRCGAEIDQMIYPRATQLQMTALVYFVQKCEAELAQSCLEFGADPSNVRDHDLAQCPQETKERIEKMLLANITKLDTPKAACPWG